MSPFETRAPGHGMAAGLPRPEPSPAGKLDEEMKRIRSAVPLRRLLFATFVAGALAFATPCLVANAWAKTAPMTVLSGDPDGGDLSPRPGPAKASTVASQGNLSTRSSVLSTVGTHGYRALMILCSRAALEGVLLRFGW